MAQRPVIASAWLKPDYRASLEAAGAEIRELTPADPLPESLASCDGLLLTGGVDVDPAEYGDAERHPTLELDAERDRYELALAREALRRDMPTLAICRGAQVLNVAAGGTLIQDIASAHPNALNHQQTTPKDLLAHTVDIATGSRLAGLLDPGESMPGVRGAEPPDQLLVNSRHHQAVRDVAEGFVASAHSPDGIIEAIEKPDASFCVAVQWHPENFHATGRFAGLFAGLIEAARQRRQS